MTSSSTAGERMLATVQLLRSAHTQLPNRQYEIGNIGSVRHTFTNVQVRDDLTMRLKLEDPADSGFGDINLARIVGPNGTQYYDIINIDSVSYKNRNIGLDLVYNPIASLITPGMVLSGFWDRTPILRQRGARVMPIEDTMGTSRIVPLPKLAVQNEGYKPFYVEVTAKRLIDALPSENNNMTIYGLFIDYSDWFPNRDSGALMGSDSSRYYLTLSEVINSISESMSLPSDTIVGISVSPRCPYETYTPFWEDQNRKGFKLKYASFNDVPMIGNGTTGFIRVAPQWDASGEGIVRNRYVQAPDQYYMTLDMNPYERAVGRMTLIDERGNEVFTVPNEWFDFSGSLKVRVYPVSDVGQQYTILHFLLPGLPAEESDRMVIIPEGSLPWVGSAWADYVMREQGYDREMMALNVSSMRQQKDIDLANSASQAILGGAMAGVAGGGPVGMAAGAGQFAIGAITSQWQFDLAVRNLEGAQAAKEKLIKNSPSPNFQPGHGYNYMYMSKKLGGAHFRIEMPMNLTEDIFNYYIRYNGYPANKYDSFTVVTGYYRGNLYTSPAVDGPKLNMLRRIFSQGVRMVIS